MWTLKVKMTSANVCERDGEVETEGVSDSSRGWHVAVHRSDTPTATPRQFTSHSVTNTRTGVHTVAHLGYAREFVLRYVQLGQLVQMLAALLNRRAGKHLRMVCQH